MIFWIYIFFGYSLYTIWKQHLMKYATRDLLCTLRVNCPKKRWSCNHPLPVDYGDLPYNDTQVNCHSAYISRWQMWINRNSFNQNVENRNMSKPNESYQTRRFICFQTFCFTYIYLCCIFTHIRLFISYNQFEQV